MANEICHFSVCPHDTANNQVVWFTLNTYLQRKLEVRMRFEPESNLIKERETVLSQPHHVVYANPFSAVCFLEKGYVPVARPIGLNDETLLIGKEDFDIAAAARPIKVASASDKLIIHPLGLTLLPGMGLSADDVTFDFCGNHMNAVKAVLNGTSQLGFVFNETWGALSKSTRATLKVLAETKDGKAFHCFMVGEEWKDRVTQVQQELCNMNTDPAGKSIIDELGFSGIEAITPDALDAIKTLMT